MNREQISSLIRAHLADELEIDPSRITEDDALQRGSRGRFA